MRPSLEQATHVLNEVNERRGFYKQSQRAVADSSAAWGTNDEGGMAFRLRSHLQAQDSGCRGSRPPDPARF